MNKKALVFITLLALSFATCLPVVALSAEDTSGDQDRLRLQLRDRLCVTDGAMEMKQDRERIHQQDRVNFPDCEYHWSREQVQNAYCWGLVEGYPDGNYGPDKNVSGIEGLMIMARTMNCIQGIEDDIVTPGGVDWDGIPEWARLRLQDQNALRLMNQTMYYMEPQLNRLMVAVMLAKGLEIEPVVTPVSTQLAFKDQNGIPKEYLGYVMALRQMGIVVGDNGYFYPQRLVTRAEIATMMGRTLDILD